MRSVAEISRFLLRRRRNCVMLGAGIESGDNVMTTIPDRRRPRPHPPLERTPDTPRRRRLSIVVLPLLAVGVALAIAAGRPTPAANPVHGAPAVPEPPAAVADSGISGAPFSAPLYIPPVLTDANVSITMAQTCVQLLPGPCTTMWTYNGTYPGPTIRRPTGQTTQVEFTNDLPAAAGSTTVHNHGNHSTSQDDGQPMTQLINSGGSYTYTYNHQEDGGNERGATQWYHDHRMEVTGRNVWMGLAGFYILDDPADPQTLPAGQYDIPIMISNRAFDANNQLSYNFNRGGVAGLTQLVNGRPQPYLEVGDRTYRFRILNGSNASVYFFALSDGEEFIQVGTESGILPAPVNRTEMRAGPAERVDVAIDFSGKLGQTLYLVDNLREESLLEFRVTQDVTDTSSVPPVMRALPDLGPSTVTREFAFNEAGNRWTINGQVFDVNRYDAEPVLGSTETWILTNSSATAIHTAHVHGVDAQCVSRNFQPCYSYEPMKETWFLAPGERLELKLKFSDNLGPFVLHCHVLEHEDDGMMSQYNVVEPPSTPTATPTPAAPSPTPTPSPTKTPVPGDSDLDGCTNTQEGGALRELGGLRNANDFWDFYDVTDDRAIDLSDALLILGHFGDAHNQDPLDPLLDRTIPDIDVPWRTAAEFDGIDLTDALNNLYSFGDTCAP